MTQPDNLSKLAEPLPSSDIEWRVGSVTKDKKRGQALPYLSFEACARYLDAVVGVANWSADFKAGPAGGVICRLGIRVEGDWVYKENGAENTDIESVKGGLTDAFKRACAMWGIGRYLYRHTAGWHDLDERGRLVSTPQLPDWALPAAERQAKPAAANKASKPAAPVNKPSEPSERPAADKPATPSEPAPETSATGTSTPAPAAGTTDEASDLPAGLSSKAQTMVKDLLAKVGKVPQNLLDDYLAGNRARESLGEAGVAYARQKMQEMAGKTKVAA